jgi:lipopolysaccharide/colanic/teichoic acid biosynthesis glycosyltransferase
VLFRQKRIGYREREFDIFKFRTMHAVDQPEKHLTQRNDPRVFKFGSLLRKTSLDELPQLLNVLKGDMSLVGPRPHMPEARAAGLLYFKAVNDYADRHRVKPGITGWAQVNGWRGPTETIEQIERRVEHDVYYIENWSLMFDCIIIVETIFFGFGGKNAF